MHLLGCIAKYLRPTPFKLYLGNCDGYFYRRFVFSLALFRKDSMLNHNFSRTIYWTVQGLSKVVRAGNENIAVHRIMENNEAYSKTVIRHPKYSSPKLPEIELGSAYRSFHDVTFRELAKGGFEDSKFTQLVPMLVESFPDASFEEIVHTFYILCFWPQDKPTQGKNYKILWNELDRVCTSRLNHWDVSQKLLIADYMFHLQLSRISKYNSSVIRSLLAKQDMLSSSELIQLIFLINIQRNIPQTLLTGIERKLESVVSLVNVKELCIICLGYFKTANGIKNVKVLKAILDRVMANVEEIESDPVHIVAVLKCARKSFKPYFIGNYLKFLEMCSHNCHKWDMLTSVHAASLSSATYVFEPTILDNAIDKVGKIVHKARLKDMCKLLQCLSYFNYSPFSEFNDIIFKELLGKEREEEIQAYFVDFVYLVMFYSYLGHFNYGLLEMVFTTERINTLREYDKKSLCLLDYSIEIECENYDGLRLSKSLRSSIMTKVQSSECEDSDLTKNVKRYITKVMETLNSFDGLCQNICVRQVLPYFVNPVIVIRIRAKTNAIPLVELLQEHPTLEILKPPSDEVWGCIIVCGVHSFVFNSKRQSGLTVMHQRQLAKLGYKTLLIDGRVIPLNLMHRHAFLKAKLSELYGDDDLLTASQ